jgi:carboxymethylenebutenolidase
VGLEPPLVAQDARHPGRVGDAAVAHPVALLGPDGLRRGGVELRLVVLDEVDLLAAAGQVAEAGRVGVVGYCWGGGQSLNFATKNKDLNAAVVYYGRNPDPLDSVANIPCPVMGNYAEDDPNIMPGVEPLKAAMQKAGKSFDVKTYPGAKHAFNNNTNADRYNPEAAKDAWGRTVSFFKKHLA